MNNKASVDVIRRVIDHDEGAALTVGPWPEAPDVALGLWVEGDKNEEWFGKLNISMSPDFAEALGGALIAAAGDFRAARLLK